jgi:hypothetical protein
VIGNTLLFAECHAGEAGSLAFGHDLLPVVLSMAIYSDPQGGCGQNRWPLTPIYLLYIKLLEALYFSR